MDTGFLAHRKKAEKTPCPDKKPEIMSSTMTSTEQYQEWVREFADKVRNASDAFTPDDFPVAWLMLGEKKTQWYQEGTLLNRPVFRSPASLSHCGPDGKGQVIIPLWLGDVSKTKFTEMRREFEARLAKSGNF